MPIPTYRDIDFNFGKIDDSLISIKQNDNDLIQSIKNIILSSNGEVPFTRDRIGLLERKFDTIRPIEILVLQQDIKNTINLVDPRIIVNNVIVEQIESNLNVTVSFTLKEVPTFSKTIVIKSGPD